MSSRRPHHVTADSKYDTLENAAALEEAGVRAYVAPHESGSKPGFFAKGEFRYDPEADVYSCTAGKLLRPVGKKEGEDRSDGETYYRARASACAPCPLKPRCTTNKNGRQLCRYPGERHVDLVRSYRGTASYEKALRKQKVWVEPLFRGSDRLARDAEIPLEDLAQSERRGAAGGGRPEHKEVAEKV